MDSPGSRFHPPERCRRLPSPWLALACLALCAAPAAAKRVGGLPSPVRISSMAECEGPGGGFRTTVECQRWGPLRLEQAWPDGRRSRSGLDTLGAWVWDEKAGHADSVGAAAAFQMFAHAFHALDLWEEEWLGRPLSVRTATSGGRRVESREFERWGGRIWADRDARTARVLSWRFEPPGLAPAQGVVVRVLERQRMQDRELITRLVLEQGGNTWRYHFTRVELLDSPGGALARP